jgi:hypothetical protein
MNKLRQVILTIVGQLFNKTVSITRDAFLIAEGITQRINGEVTKVRTEYKTGTTGNTPTTSVPHNLANATYILDVDGDIQHEDGYWAVKEYARVPTVNDGFQVIYDDTNIVFSNIGVSFRNQPYKVKVTYIVD